MKNIADGDGRIIWLPSQAKGYSGNSSEPTVALGRVMKNTVTNQGDFIILVEVYLKEIGKQSARS